MSDWNDTAAAVDEVRNHLDRLNQIGEDYRALNASIRFPDYTTPLNLNDERARFLADPSTTVSPDFQYHEVPDGIEEPWQAFLSATSPDGPFAAAVCHAASRTMQRIELLRERDAERLTALNLAGHGRPSASELAHAEEILARDHAADATDATSGQFDAEAAAAILRRTLVQLGLHDWQVLVEPAMTARMSVSGPNETVRVQAIATFGIPEMRRMLVHEIGVHVLRAVNGASQPLRLMSNGLEGYMSTEEGLAIHLEALAGPPSPRRLRILAVRLLAAELALENEFLHVFAFAKDHLDFEDAWNVTVRAKRGMAADQPGSTMKDIVYLSGMLRVGSHLADHPEALGQLFVGKVSLEMLPTSNALLEAGLINAPSVTIDDLLARLANDPGAVDPDGAVLDGWPTISA